MIATLGYPGHQSCNFFPRMKNVKTFSIDFDDKNFHSLRFRPREKVTESRCPEDKIQTIAKRIGEQFVCKSVDEREAFPALCLFCKGRR